MAIDGITASYYFGGMSNPVDSLIERFGSQAALGEAAGVSQPSVWKWRKRGFVPSDRIPEILKAAKQRGIALEHRDFFPPEPERVAS